MVATCKVYQLGVWLELTCSRESQIFRTSSRDGVFLKIFSTRWSSRISSLFGTMDVEEAKRLWWVRDDCCGVFCGFFTPGLTLYALLVQYTFVLGPHFGFLHPITIFYGLITLLAILSHGKAQFTNPGAVPLDLDNDLKDLESSHAGNSASNPQNGQHRGRYCHRCRQRKPIDAHHCSICNRCIIKMDHHCPWVNNCVAMYNQKYFVLFLFYTALCCAFCLTSLIYRFITCKSKGLFRFLPFKE